MTQFKPGDRVTTKDGTKMLVSHQASTSSNAVLLESLPGDEPYINGWFALDTIKKSRAAKKADE